jgi:hypothetical protein
MSEQVIIAAINALVVVISVYLGRKQSRREHCEALKHAVEIKHLLNGRK